MHIEYANLIFVDCELKQWRLYPVLYFIIVFRRALS